MRGPMACSVASLRGLLRSSLEMRLQESDSGDMVRGGPGHHGCPRCAGRLFSLSFSDVSSRENTLIFH